MEHGAEPGPTERETVVIGVLGGIASGKSAVAERLAGPGGRVIDADRMAREVLEGPELRPLLVEAFGPQVIGPDGRPDREALGERVFSDAEARQRLEGWIHPRVRERIRLGLQEARTAGQSPVVLDVPLLLENDAQHGLVRQCDFLVFVAADADLRDQRAVERRGWRPGEVARREAAQTPLEEKEQRARHVIRNDAGLDELQARVDDLLRAEGLA